LKKLAILFGSQSYEHEISIVSAIAMKKVLNNELVFIFIDKNREYYHIPTSTITSKIFSSGEYKKCDKLFLTQDGFASKGLFGSKPLEFDTLINLVHGQDGEDGTLSGILKFYHIPYIGPRVEACVVSFDKFVTKTYAQNCDVKVLSYQYFHKDQEINIDDFPCIIKPTKLGSSLGISIVKDSSELDYALDTAFEFDDTIIVEPFVQDVKEYNLAGTKIDGKFIFSIVEEPSKEEFLDFEKKYLDFNRTSQVNQAEIDENLTKKLKDNFIKIYNSTFEGAIIRCDFFVVDNEVYLNEINPIPGSMANYLFNDFNKLVNDLTNSLPKEKIININYEYVNQIQKAKGK